MDHGARWHKPRSPSESLDTVRGGSKMAERKSGVQPTSAAQTTCMKGNFPKVEALAGECCEPRSKVCGWGSTRLDVERIGFPMESRRKP